MERGCGCFWFSLAVLLGLVLGVVGLGAAGYWWANAKVLAHEPMAMPVEKWGTLDEAALTVKLAPLALAIKQNKQTERELVLKANEANRLVDRYILTGPDDYRVRMSFGNTATAVLFSRKVMEGKYVNGELRADISAKDGDFEVEVIGLRTGEYKWPKPLLPQAARWLEGILETQSLFQNDPWRVMDYSYQKDKLKLKVRTVSQTESAPVEE